MSFSHRWTGLTTRGSLCECSGCVATAHRLTGDAFAGEYDPGPAACERIAIVLRSCVVAGLVDLMTGGAA